MSEQQNTNTATNKKWGDIEKAEWLQQQVIKRSYQDDVVTRIDNLKSDFDIEQYGELTYLSNNNLTNSYPLYIIKSRQWNVNKPTILVTGGVHGYETSGVHGAIDFVEQQALNYSDKFNIIVAPCVSPWGYETINRWNPEAIDPNRSFYVNSPSQEAASIINYIASLNVEIFAHIDLHETTDTDNTTFRPALAARDAIEQSTWNIPDGFYLVGDTEQPNDEFQKAIITKVEPVTHIAPADETGRIIGVMLSQKGVINYPTKKLGLCAGFTNANYVTTTEVYPDSPQVSNVQCNSAQVAAIIGGLEYLVGRL
ncbi:MAG: M14 family metallocarboxypeptidase [Psychromonas sp.]